MSEPRKRIERLVSMANYYMDSSEAALRKALEKLEAGEYDEALEAARLGALGLETVLVVRDNLMKLQEEDEKSAESAA